MSLLTSCKSENKKDEEQKVVIYTNADEEPVKDIIDTLDNNGYKDKYMMQSFGTSELGGKLFAEGNKMEADLITMSTYSVDTVQKENEMFKEVSIEMVPLKDDSKYAYPLTVQEGVIFFNTNVLNEEKLDIPASIKDLADPKYIGQLSIPDIEHSSTAWLMFQSLIDNYGEYEAKKILKSIYKNAENHLEQSGSGPLKKVRVGEVAIGFGLAHQAIRDKNEGYPIDYIEPSEGVYSLTESIAVVEKGDKTNPEAEKMMNLILDKGRKKIIKSYPSLLYENESVEGSEVSKNKKEFKEKLTTELLEEHKKLVK